jgi:hypothetical protein
MEQSARNSRGGWHDIGRSMVSTWRKCRSMPWMDKNSLGPREHYQIIELYAESMRTTAICSKSNAPRETEAKLNAPLDVPILGKRLVR